MSSSNNQAPAKKSRGRQKMKMQKMENESNLRVTFSKRRAGIFKKASELCVLCAAEALIIIFSPAKKAFSYGHPGVERIINRFLDGDDPEADPNTTDARIDEMAMKYSIRTRNLELTQMRNLLKIERKRGEELDAAIKAGQIEGWIPPPFEDFSDEQLDFFEKTVSNFKKHLDEEVAKFKSLNLNPTSGFNETNELYATGDRNVTNNISFFYPNNNPSFPHGHGLNDVATHFKDTGLYATGGTSASNNMGEVPFPYEFNSWAAANFSDTGVNATGQTSAANNVGAFSVPAEFSEWPADFCDTGVNATGQTSAANNIGSFSVPAEFSQWAADFCDTGVYTGGTSGANNAGKVPEQNEFSNWAQGFGYTGALATGEASAANNTGSFSGPDDLSDWLAGFCDTSVFTDDTSCANNVGAIPEQSEFNNWAPGFGNTGAVATGVTSGTNNIGTAQLPHELNNWTPGFGDTGVNNFSVQAPNYPFTAPNNPNVPGGDPDPFNLMTRDPTDPILFGGSRSSLFPGFDDSSGAGLSQF